MTHPEITDWIQNPTNPLELEDPSLLADFEDELAMEMLPEMDSDNYTIWMSRVALKDIVRPPSFFGSIQEVQVTALDNPYERLLDARKRSLEFSDDGGIIHINSRLRDFTQYMHAYSLSLTTASGIERTPGAIETEAWYVPTASFGTGKDGFQPIRRSVAIPKLYEVGSDGTKLVTPQNSKYRGLNPHRYDMPGSRRGASRRITDL
ncbi:hypothetical protein EPN95_04160 [Patescibacteria group bacterium]|nr:MAG: hypothetical protein EPN95_04160 [Patescibacteria group bacterium]